MAEDFFLKSEGWDYFLMTFFMIYSLTCSNYLDESLSMNTISISFFSDDYDMNFFFSLLYILIFM